jgi:hypothetical protein
LTGFLKRTGDKRFLPRFDRDVLDVFFIFAFPTLQPAEHGQGFLAPVGD